MGTSTYGMVWDWFGLWYYMDWDCLLISFLVTIQIGTAFSFPFLLLYRLGLPSHFLFRVLYKFGTVFLIEYYTGFGLVLSQVGSVPQLYLRSFEVEEEP